MITDIDIGYLAGKRDGLQVRLRRDTRGMLVHLLGDGLQ